MSAMRRYLLSERGMSIGMKLIRHIHERRNEKSIKLPEKVRKRHKCEEWCSITTSRNQLNAWLEDKKKKKMFQTTPHLQPHISFCTGTTEVI